MIKVTLQYLILISLSFLFGCQKNEQLAFRKSQNSIYQGPSDSGGGDTCNGKLIESYKVDVTTLPEFKLYLKPIFEKLVLGDFKKELNKSSSPFEFSTKMKNWYFIDCKLKEIPNEKKGLYLESYQTAIHTSREIFIDLTSYNLMSEEEKSKLILHEIVMAYYLTKYLSIEQICKISNICNSEYLKISSWKMFRPEVYKSLNEEDHQKIRHVMSWLWSNKNNLNKENFITLLKNNDFDKRFSLSAEIEKNKPIQVQILPESLIRMFKKYQWTNAFPKFCHFNETSNLSESTCDVNVNSEIRNIKILNNSLIKHLSLKIKITRNSDNKVFQQEFLYPLVGINPSVVLHVNKYGNILNAAPLAMTANWPTQPELKLEEGMKSQMLIIFLNVSDLEKPEIYQMLFRTYVWYSFEDVINEVDGARYKNSYGYPAVIDNESEVIFIENELPFNVNLGFLKGKTFLRSNLLVN